MLRTLFLASGLAFMLALTACDEGGEEAIPTDVPPAAEPVEPTAPPAEPAQQ